MIPMIPLKFFAQIVNNHLVFDDASSFKNYLQRYNGKEIEVCIKQRQKPKSQNQLGYFFGHIILQMAEHFGYTDEEMYGILKHKFLIKFMDTEKEYVQSLSELSRKETADFIDHCIRFGLELGVEIYPPEVFYG